MRRSKLLSAAEIVAIVTPPECALLGVPRDSVRKSTRLPRNGYGFTSDRGDRAAFNFKNSNGLLTLPVRSTFPGGSELQRRGGPLNRPTRS